MDKLFWSCSREDKMIYFVLLLCLDERNLWKHSCFGRAPVKSPCTLDWQLFRSLSLLISCKLFFVLFCSFTHITSERTQRAVLRKSGKTFFTSRKFTSVSKQHLRPKHLKRIQQVILLFTPSHTPFFNVTSKKVCCEIKTVVQRHNTYYSRYMCRLKQSFKESAGPHLFFSFSAKNLTISEV